MYRAKGGALFHFSGDLSGDVIVANGVGEESRVTFADLAEFVDTHRKLRSPRGPPRDPTKAEERARALVRAKESVVNAILRVAEPDAEHFLLHGMDGSWPSELEQQLFKVAVNSVKGAR